MKSIIEDQIISWNLIFILYIRKLLLDYFFQNIITIKEKLNEFTMSILFQLQYFALNDTRRKYKYNFFFNITSFLNISYDTFNLKNFFMNIFITKI